ncbi:MAG: hypothetical protein LUE92_00645 [Clostridiales bacterium]|nr:hypothetical protein [Clostridiales bacterium]
MKRSMILYGESNGKTFERKFEIRKKLGEGASSICYEAHHENSGNGTLKEFLPANICTFERDKERGSVVETSEFKGDYERFLEAKEEYVKPYHELMRIKRSGVNEDLATFIPEFEIYQGYIDDENTVGTVYVWTPDCKKVTFEKVCDEIHKHPNKNPERKLITVLNAIESLTKCVCAFHSAGLIHRDIKPSNFGFDKYEGETLTQTLKMFDINSVCSVYERNIVRMGSEGFQEPEAEYGQAPDNQTDIFSIGASLFYALIVPEETEKNKKKEECYYNPDYYDRLREMVDDSRLIKASEANSHPKLKNILIRILEKCLGERSIRYERCEELLEDLNKAKYYALPSEIARKQMAGERWILADLEKSLDASIEKNSFLTIQYHLYEFPLYTYCAEGEDTINVLVIGFGNYGQKFLDACLQSGQIRGKRLNVTVVSDDCEDKRIYLEDRPELTKFFNIEGSLAGDEESYGDVSFEIRNLKRDEPDAVIKIIQDITLEHYESKCLHYIFIALGEDGLNKVAADSYKEVAEVAEKDCVVSYVCEGEHSAVKQDSMLRPLYVNEDIKKSALYPEIERMAFNTHLLWEKNLNIDYRSVRAEFRKKYNHDSSVSSVLSLKYKLYSIGIDLDKTGYNEAAQKFEETIKKSSGIKNELIWIEHRRWVAEKVCLGWRRIKNIGECAGGKTNNKKEKRHICIVKSRPDQMLADEYWKNDNYDKWDKAGKKKLDELDELDRMSVNLHRMFVNMANRAKKENLLSGNMISGIITLVRDDEKAAAAFQEWFGCMKDIWNGDTRKVHLYRGLKKDFLDTVNSLPDKDLDKAKKKTYTIWLKHLTIVSILFWQIQSIATGNRMM